MARGNVKGITIEIGGDTTKLDKALKKVDDELQSSQRSLKDVQRLLKLDPKNTELLAQKQTLLARSVDATKERLETLKRAQEQFVVTDNNADQYAALKREIIATEQSLKKLEDAARQSNSVLGKMADAADKLGQGAGKVADRTKAISTAALGGATALGALAVKAGAAADDINTLAKQSGFGTDEIQKWQYAADRIDVSVDDIVGAAKKLKKNMSSSSKDVAAAWETLGVSVVNENGKIRSSTEVFYDTVAALGEIEDETERDLIAMTLFGKSADNLAGILDDGGKAMKELGAEAEAAGLVLSQDALDGANAFNDGLDKIKAQAAGAAMSAGSALAQNLLPEMEKLVEKMSSVMEWIAKLNGDQLRWLATILLLVAGISPLAKAISGIATVTSGVIKSMQALSGVMSFLAANPIVLIIAGITALIAILIACYKHFDGFRDGVLAVKNAIITNLTAAMDFLAGLPAKALQWGKDFISGFVDGIKQSIGAVTDAVKGVAEKVRSFLHFSRPDVGPLRDYETWMPDFIDGLARGLRDNQGKLGRALQAVTGSMEASFSPVISAGGAGTTTVRHTFDPLRVEGVTDSGQFVAAAEYSVEEVLTDLMRRQSRL